MDEIDLDFDDALANDAEAFGQQNAQGDADLLSQRSEPIVIPVPIPELNTLENALRVAREVYGETNSEHSEEFCCWVQVVLEGGVDIEEAEKMLTLLHKDKESFGGRIGWAGWMDEHPEKIVRLRARRHASICAMNIVHAVLNQFKGKSPALWIERSLWRATRAEKDVKCEK